MNDENNNVQNVNNNEKETIQNIENNNVENNVVQNEMNQNIVKNQDLSNQNMQEQITTNNNSNDEDSDSVNLKRVKDLIIAIILSILVIYFGRSMILDGLNADGNNSIYEIENMFHSILNSFTAIIGFLGTIMLLAIIWVMYFTKPSRERIKARMNSKTRRTVRIVYVISYILIPTFIMLFIWWKIYDFLGNDVAHYNAWMNLKEVLDMTDERAGSDYEPSFIYKDKIYFYDSGHITKFNGEVVYYHKLYQMDLNGKHRKVISNSDKLKTGNFNFVYNNEVYFYSIKDNDYIVFNLKTKDIRNLDVGGSYVANSLKNNHIYVYNYTNTSNENNERYTNILLRKVNLDTNKTISEIKLDNIDGSIQIEDVFVDYKYGNIYYKLENKFDSLYIYKNGEIVYQIENDKIDKDNFTFLAATEGYIYFTDKKIIYKVDIVNKILEKEITNNFSNIERIDDGEGLNYFYDNKNIYYLDTDSDEFIQVLSDISGLPEKAQSVNNLIIFKGYEEKNYKNNKLRSIIVYDTQTKSKKQYDDIYKYYIEENYIYLLKYKDNNYVVDKVKLY